MYCPARRESIMVDFMFKPVPAGEAGFSSEPLQALKLYFDALIAGGAFPGIVALLARGDQLVMGHTAGYADIESKAPLHADSIFTLFSMTKPLTAVGMLLLHEEGRWNLDDPISLHLPEFKDIAGLPGSCATREPTIRELFTHTAGLSFGKTPEEMTRFLQTTNLPPPPFLPRPDGPLPPPAARL